MGAPNLAELDQKPFVYGPIEVVTVKQAATLLGLTYWKTRTLALSGEIPLVRYPSKAARNGIERRLRVRLADVYAYIERHTEPKPTWKKPGRR